MQATAPALPLLLATEFKKSYPRWSVASQVNVWLRRGGLGRHDTGVMDVCGVSVAAGLGHAGCGASCIGGGHSSGCQAAGLQPQLPMIRWLAGSQGQHGGL